MEVEPSNTQIDTENTIVSSEKYKNILKVMRRELVEQIEILLEFEKEPPFLSKFNNFIRRKAIIKLSLELCGEVYDPSSVNDPHKSAQTSKENNFSEIQKREIYQKVSQLVDYDLLPYYIERVQNRAQKQRVFSQSEGVLEKLSLPEELKEIMPISSSQKIQLYRLCTKWVISVEKNTDLITRCITYGLVNRKKFGDYKKTIKEANCPSRSIMLVGKSRFAQLCFNFVIDRVYSKLLNSLTDGIRSVVVSYLIYMAFGPLSLTLVGMLSNVIDIPFISNFSQQSFLTKKVTNYSLQLIMKVTNLDSQEICQFLIRESLTEMNNLNLKIEKMIEMMLSTKITSQDFKIYKKQLEKQLGMLFKKSSNKGIDQDMWDQKTSGAAQKGDLDADHFTMTKFEDDWVQFDNIEVKESGVVESDGDEFITVDYDIEEEAELVGGEDSEVEDFELLELDFNRCLNKNKKKKDLVKEEHEQEVPEVKDFEDKKGPEEEESDTFCLEESFGPYCSILDEILPCSEGDGATSGINNIPGQGQDFKRHKREKNTSKKSGVDNILSGLEPLQGCEGEEEKIQSFNKKISYYFQQEQKQEGDLSMIMKEQILTTAFLSNLLLNKLLKSQNKKSHFLSMLTHQLSNQTPNKLKKMKPEKHHKRTPPPPLDIPSQLQKQIPAQSMDLDINLDLIGQLYEEKIGGLSKDAPFLDKRHKAFILKAEEYDPTMPNDYEKLLKERIQRMEKEVLEKIEERRAKESRNPSSTSKKGARSRNPHDSSNKKGSHGGIGNQIRKGLQPLYQNIDPKILKMMQNDGWNGVGGLGKNENGIKNPLSVIKTANNSAVISSKRREVDYGEDLRNQMEPAPFDFFSEKQLVTEYYTNLY